MEKILIRSFLPFQPLNHKVKESAAIQYVLLHYDHTHHCFYLYLLVKMEKKHHTIRKCREGEHLEMMTKRERERERVSRNDHQRVP